MQSKRSLAAAATLVIAAWLVVGNPTSAIPADGGASAKAAADTGDASQAQLLAREAQSLLKKGARNEAKKKAREALALDSKNDKAAEVLGSIEGIEQRARRRALQREVAKSTRLIREGKYEEAAERLEAVLRQNPDHPTAQKQLAAAHAGLALKRGKQTRARGKARRDRARKLLVEGLAAQRGKDVETAVAKWREVLLLDPANQRARQFLKEVAPEYDRLEADNRADAARAQAEAAARRKMAEKITIEVKEGTRLRGFLNTLSFVTGVNFVIVRGADAQVVAKFEDKPLHQILDSVLTPNSLEWTRQGDIVTIAPQLRTRVFHLNADALLGAQRLYESGELQRILWNSDTPPIAGIELRIDERQSKLFLTDSVGNIMKMEQFIGQLRQTAPPKLITKIYSVRKDLAKDIKILVEAVLKAEEVSEYALMRKVILTEHERAADLILKDTEENLRKIEELLNDRDFLRHVEEEDIQVYTTNLTPRDVLTANPEQVEAFGRDVKEVVETMLYHKDGMTAARARGRRLWYDPATLQLTITDSAANIRKVADFVESLPQLKTRSRSKIIYLEYANAADMASQLEQILGGTAGAGGTGTAGFEASFSLRVQDERTFRDLSIRLTRVDANDFIDENDDSAELVVRTSTAQSSDLNITEYRSEMFEGYEIYVEQVRPSPTPGEGRVRLRVTYRPELGAPVY